MEVKGAIQLLELHRWKNPRSAITLEGFKNVEVLLLELEKYKDNGKNRIDKSKKSLPEEDPNLIQYQYRKELRR